MFVLASNYFQKCFFVNAGVWLRMENGFSGKEFQLTVKLRPLTRKIFSAKILPSNHFRRRAKRERERERTHMRKHRERERDREPRKPKIVAPPARSSNPWTLNLKNPRSSNLRSSHREPTNSELHCEPTNPRTASRTIIDLDLVLVTGESHRYQSRSCDFDFLLSLFDLWFFCCCCGGVGGDVLVVFLLCGGGFCVGGGGK